MDRLACFDLDGTLIHGFPADSPYIWRLLHRHHGSPEADLEAWRRRFVAGDCSYDEWFQHDVRCLQARGATRRSLVEAMAPLRAVDGVHQVFEALRGAGYRVTLLSGSVDLAFEAFFPDVVLDAAFLNRFSFDGAGRLVGGVSTAYDMARKADGLRHLAARYGVSMDRTVFVGDAANDVDVARVAGIAVAFNCADPRLAEVATHVVSAPARDLRAILPLIGLEG